MRFFKFQFFSRFRSIGTLLSYLCSMLTKYYIEIDGEKAEVPKGCLKNWDEIKCVYKRSDFSGVTRSFTTQFEFVGEMYDRLMALYLRDGVNARAVLSLYTITNEWAWEEQFTCDLDFSSIEWDNYVVKMNCIDDSLAAAIKAKKSTKFEFVVGQDIPMANTLEYDRIIMPNSVVHGIMSNGDDSRYKDGSVVLVQSSSLKRVPVYVIGDAETYENSPIVFGDEADESGSYFLKIENAVSKLSLDIEINYYGRKQPFNSVVTNAEIYLMRFDSANPDINSNYVNLGTVFKVEETEWVGTSRTCVGCFSSLSALKKAYPNPPQDVYAIIGKSAKVGECEAVYFTPVTLNVKTEWLPGRGSLTGGRNSEYVICNEHRFLSHFDLSSSTASSMFALVYKCNIHFDHWSPNEFHIALQSKISTKWESRAKTISINALRPNDVLRAVIDKIVDNNLNISTEIANNDSRLAKTFLFAAESVRNIPGAKFYTSFNDFCDWMETVFGYTYYLGERTKARFKRTQQYSLEWPLGTSHLLHTPCPGGHGSQVVIIEGTPYFAVLGDDYNADGTLNFYTKWDGSDAYNDPATGKARLDTLFYDEDYNQGRYFDDAYTLQLYAGDASKGACDSQTIYFVPRAEIFAGTKTVRLPNIRELNFSINSGIAYSSLTIGYDKQEYEAECGRDEWNFSAQYTTGVDKFEKKLSLISKYRADCYGFEFLSQERAKDTKDNKSDNTVFFILCQSQDDEQSDSSSDSRGDSDEDSIVTRSLICDRTAVISGALSDTIFNGEYSPYKCVQANAAYIAAAKCPMTLKFASFDGNTEVSIDGIKGNADLQLTEQLFTLGEVQFSSADVDTELDVNALYEVQSNGITYRGFLKEVSFKYAKAETVKYKLIVKEIEL